MILETLSKEVVTNDIQIELHRRIHAVHHHANEELSMHEDLIGGVNERVGIQHVEARVRADRLEGLVLVEASHRIALPIGESLIVFHAQSLHGGDHRVGVGEDGVRIGHVALQELHAGDRYVLTNNDHGLHQSAKDVFR